MSAKTNPFRFHVLQGLAERYAGAGALTRSSREERRAAVLSYEQIVAGHGLFLGEEAFQLAVVASTPPRTQIAADDLVRDPPAHPVAPPRPPRAAKPVYESAPAPDRAIEEPDVETALSVEESGGLVVEPVEPTAEPWHGNADTPVRQRLSPSQRAAQLRPETRLNRDGKTTYVTYTVDPTSEK